MIPNDWLETNSRLIHSLKTALAVLLCFFITEAVHFPMGQWLIITILVIMCAQMNVGSVIQKSYMRFLGTLIGTIIAAGTLILVGTSFTGIAIAITLATIFFSYIATSQKSYSDSGTLGAVTVIIILVTHNPTLANAGERFLEISAGILIAALISLFIFPIHARRYLRKHQAQVIYLLRDYYAETFLRDKESELKHFSTIDNAIVKSLIAQRKLATDAAREPINKDYKIKFFNKSISCEKEILYSIAFMHEAYERSPHVKAIFSTMESFKDFNQAVHSTLEKIANSLKKNTLDKTIAIPNLKPLAESIHAASKIFNAEDLVSANGFLFCAQVLITKMNKLLRVTEKVNVK